MFSDSGLSNSYTTSACLGSVWFFFTTSLSRSAPLLPHQQKKRTSLPTLCSFAFSSLSSLLSWTWIKTRNIRKQGSLTVSLSDRPVKQVGSRFTCLGASFSILRGFFHRCRTHKTLNLNSVESRHQLAIAKRKNNNQSPTMQNKTALYTAHIKTLTSAQKLACYHNLSLYLYCRVFLWGQYHLSTL